MIAIPAGLTIRRRIGNSEPAICRSADLIDTAGGTTILGGARLPFGGVGDSGMGAHHGMAGFDALSHHKSVLYKPQRPDLHLVYPPSTKRAEKILRRIV